MTSDRWQKLVARIEGDDIESMVEACESLTKEATLDDVPGLLLMLEHQDFVVREAAAWPLAVLGVTEYFPKLFDAYERGLTQGHDHDGFTTALIEMATLHPRTARRELETLLHSQNDNYSRRARWLLDFC